MKLPSSVTFLPALFLILLLKPVSAQRVFKEYFTGERLRMDFIMSGDVESLIIGEVSYAREPRWGGSNFNLIDTFRYGEMLVEMHDSASNELIYSRGFSTLFQEWQTTDRAAIADTSIIQILQLPFPRSAVAIQLFRRHREGFKKIFSSAFNPENSFYTVKKKPDSLIMNKIHRSGKPSESLDIVFLAEGYTAKEVLEFNIRTGELMNALFTWSPYDRYKQDINIYTAFLPSGDSGTDNPLDSIWVNTMFHSSYNTFGSDRYMTSTHMASIYDAVCSVPYDQLIVLINTEKYGGGAIYNFFTFMSADNAFSEFLLVHEFGHAFASLADEYFTSSVAYNNYYDLHIEPYQPNITTLNNFEEKWVSIISDTVPVPTPDSSIYSNTVGVFEGAGYSAEGIYRPYRTCAMKSKYTTSFCPVCEKAISDMIRFYTEKGHE